MEIEINRVHESDVEKLKNISLKTFNQSYKHLNTASNCNWYIQKAFTTDKLLSEIRNHKSFIYFVVCDQDVVGYLKLNIGDSQSEKFGDEYIEVERIYLDTNFKRMGIGKRMIQFVFNKAINQSKTKIWLKVWDKNPDAMQFYNTIGFKKSGSYSFMFGDEEQTDIIMEMDLPK